MVFLWSRCLGECVSFGAVLSNIASDFLFPVSSIRRTCPFFGGVSCSNLGQVGCERFDQCARP